MTEIETIHARPMPKRPDTGLLAWQATLGYISASFSLDAMLTIQVYPRAGGMLGWASRASWGRFSEEIRDCLSLAATLRQLWTQVDRNNVIFDTAEAVTRRPVLYADDEWLDTETKLTLDRLIQLNWAAFDADWILIIVYQPVDNPNARMQTRLLARDNTVQISGRGQTMRDACHDVYGNAARHYSGKSLDADF